MESAAAIDTSSARIGVNITATEVRELPLNGRQLSQLYLMTPGAVNGGTGNFDNFRFSGRANQQNEIRYDGIEGTGIVDTSPGNLNGQISSGFRLQSSLENIQEFRVDSNNYPAEYGTGTGGQISVVTKSGSNKFHGSVFDYLRNDALDARNFFDRAGKSSLRLNQFGASFGGPIKQDKIFFFGSYEGIRQRAGVNFLEAVPSDAARARAVPSIIPALNAFPRGNYSTSDPDFDVAFLQSKGMINENAATLRLDFKLSDKQSLYMRFSRNQAHSDTPEGVSGRHAAVDAQPQNGVLSWQRVLSPTTFNEFKFGYNGAYTRVNGVAPTIAGIDLSAITININGSVANPGISGQGASAGVTIPGGQLRQNSATNGRGQSYTPYTMSFVDHLSWIRGNHTTKFGVEIRPIRIWMDQKGGTTYTFASLNAFLANQAQQIAFLGDLSTPSKFVPGFSTDRQGRQQYNIGYAQDEWRIRQNVTLNYGLRYEYYSAMREKDNRNVIWNPTTGQIMPADSAFFQSSKANILPRLGLSWSPAALHNKTVFRIGGGVNVGPGQTEDQIQPIESDRISVTQTGGSFPVSPASLISAFDVNNLRGYQPRAYDRGYVLPERVTQWTVSLQQELPHKIVWTSAYVGSVGRHLHNRNIANLITGVGTNPATGVAIINRQFGSQFAEVDIKGTNGTDNYNALQTTVNRRFESGVVFGMQHTWAHSLGTSGGSNEAQTQSNPFELKADYGSNSHDVRHVFNFSGLYELPFGRGKRYTLSGVANQVLGGWQVSGIVNARTGLPIDLRITRPDVVYRNNVTGLITTTPVISNGAVMTTAIINTPGGGASRNVRRPDVVAGVYPFLHTSNGLLFLNPAAFATPQPGTYGDYVRHSLHGPAVGQLDLTLAKKFRFADQQNIEFRSEIYNILNHAQFGNPPALLPSALGTGTNQLQPGQPFSASTSGAAPFGVISSTLGSTIGQGTNRQIQLSLRYNF